MCSHLVTVNADRRLRRCLHYRLLMTFGLDMSFIKVTLHKEGSSYSSVTLNPFDEGLYGDRSGSQPSLVRTVEFWVTNAYYLGIYTYSPKSLFFNISVPIE
jgi:hypothetical protein